MSAIPLTQLKTGQQAYICSIEPSSAFGGLDATVGRRLADLGFSHGMPLMLVAVGVFGQGPYAVRLGNQSQFSLRFAEAQKVMCRLSGE